MCCVDRLRSPGDLYFATDHWDHDEGPDGLGRQFGVIWKSTNNGSSWTQELSYPQYGGNVDVDGADASTFCFAASLNGKLYVQLAGFSCQRRLTNSDVYDGSTWTPGPSFFPTGSSTKKVRNFNDMLVMIHGNKLYAFDGLSTTLTSDATIRDYTISGDELYVLRTSGQVCRTKNLLSYNCFDVTPSAITHLSIAALDDFVYVATTQSQIYKAPIPDRISGFFPILYYLLFD